MKNKQTPSFGELIVEGIWLAVISVFLWLLGLMAKGH
jgi:hypothetical protein